MPVVKTSRIRNLLLAALPEGEFERLEKHLRPVDLPRRKQLELSSKPIRQVYFPESGITSIVAEGGKKDTQVEIGIIGREGVTGLPILLGDDRFPYSSYMQVGGAGHMLEAEVLQELMQRSAESQRLFLNFAQTFLLQVSETAVANARARIEERLSRWLLMAGDRVGDDEINLTHEFLSLMMGARRPGVTEAMHALTKKGLIATRRGVISLQDRAGLIKHAGRYYGLPEAEYRRLILGK
jgi:CRP-like cAMP-binding protein